MAVMAGLVVRAAPEPLAGLVERVERAAPEPLEARVVPDLLEQAALVVTAELEALELQLGPAGPGVRERLAGKRV